MANFDKEFDSKNGLTINETPAGTQWEHEYRKVNLENSELKADNKKMERELYDLRLEVEKKLSKEALSTIAIRLSRDRVLKQKDHAISQLELDVKEANEKNVKLSGDLRAAQMELSGVMDAQDHNDEIVKLRKELQRWQGEIGRIQSKRDRLHIEMLRFDEHIRKQESYQMDLKNQIENLKGQLLDLRREKSIVKPKIFGVL